jgi:alkyl sulfatase BDS1-like metallo-beta-lactamase superfamily hydrolase
MKKLLCLIACALFVPACSREDVAGPGSQGQTAASAETARANREAADDLPLGDRDDFDAAEQGRIGGAESVSVRTSDGRTIWDTGAYAFETGEAPASVHPSLWRQAQLNNRHGLFEVADGIYQVRGYDLSNMSLIRGKTGWIVVDPLTSEETAAAALSLAREHLGDDPVVAVILTHSHIDHFGGIRAVAPPEDVAAEKIRIIAPKGFVEEATSENVLAGLAMGRRAAFMYGMQLERGPLGHVDSGLGKAPARGTFSILPPTEIVDRTPQNKEIDGVRFVFQYAPESEAPAELTFYLPDHKAFCGAEVVSRNMHNLYTLRGAKVRDALKWSGYIHQAIHLFGDTEVVFASHHWPTWGNEQVIDYLKKQRDTYKFIHDQTLRLANAGYTPMEIAEQLELPESLRRSFPNRGYYGTLRHNSKAVYQWYFGWYDGNPAHLDPLPPEESAKKYVELMGGAAAVLEKARASFAAAEYRWTATILDHLVFAEPDHREARELLAQTYDQLGYQAESAPWRDVYLTGAYELRRGAEGSAVDPKAAVALLREMPLERLFDAMATRVNAEKAEGTELTINFVFTDLDESYVLTIENAVLTYRHAPPDPQADATFKVTRDLWLELSTGQAGLRDLIFSDDVEVEGSRLNLLSFFSLMDRPSGAFNIVTP